ncbi:MAG: chitobiase/beta-hexosaminidase C-terminal domain-containing protein [Acidobacteriota bacterium]|nr:chitobiase/beta-hexosaminidase C-terminal domain-containing protein [Acidobacteriota bacterium]
MLLLLCFVQPQPTRAATPIGAEDAELLSRAVLNSVQPYFASAVTIAANAPAYNFQVLSGSTRQINVLLSGGTLNTVNWTVAATTGGASATFTTPQASGVASLAASLPTVQVNIGPVAGNCTIPQAQTAIGTYTVTSTATVTIQAQSVDDPTQIATFLFNVCANTTRVLVAPAYRQAYRGQHVSLQSWVTGNTDETGTWNIVSQPTGGDGTLADTTNRDADFVATVTGRYTLQYTSHADNSQSATAIVYVATTAMPAYSATPNQTEPRACEVDPALTGAVYDVGAGKPYPTLQSVPSANTWAPGTMLRVWNTDTTGSSPSTYHEFFQIHNSGTPTQPIILCGVPDIAGNLPILDGANATSQAGVSPWAAAGYGIISLWAGGYGSNTPYAYWQSGSSGPSYVTISGLHLMHATPAYSYTVPGSSATSTYVIGAACLNIRSGSYVDLGGNDLDTCTNGLFTAENTNSAFAPVTQLVTFMGNHVHGSGWAQDFTEHQLYFQSFFGVMQGNLLDHYSTTALGSNVKWRGVEGIFRYNVLSSGPTRDFDLVENQDATPYVSFEAYLAPHGDKNCYDSLYCAGDTAGPNIIAAYQESAQKDFIYGNIIQGASSQYQIHYGEDHDGQMADRNGVLYFYNNTLDHAQVVFDTGSALGYNPIYTQRISAQNNLLWSAGSQVEFGRYASIIGTWTTNMMKAGSFGIATPILGGNYNAGTANGWEATCDNSTCFWPLTVPIDAHQYGLSATNFLTLPTQPYSATTFVPISDPALALGTPLAGAAATLPIRWQYSIASSALAPRVNPAVLGAADSGAPASGATAPTTPIAATPSFSVAAGVYTTAQSVLIADATPGATIYYTTDGSTPTTSSAVYTAALNITSTTTVKAMAVVAGDTNSSIAVATYTIAVSTPTFSLAAGNYTTAQTVSIADATPGATIYYTTDGSTPTTSSSVYTAPILISTATTLQAIAVLSGYTNSAVASAAYTIGAATAATPIFSLASGTYTTIQNVTIVDSTAGAILYYTTNGATPTTSSAIYTGPINVASSMTLKAIAVASGYSNSAAAAAAYTINLVPASAPVFSLPSGTYLGPQTLSISDATNSVSIYYTTDGSTPTTSSPLYTGPISISGSETVQAIAASREHPAGPVGVAVYTISAASAAATPVLSLTPGTYTAAQVVSISDATPNATIYYTTNGTVPTTASSIYTGPLAVSATETLQAIAVVPGYGNSQVASAVYVIAPATTQTGSSQNGAAATPAISLPAGTYSTTQNVTITDSTPGASIYYTTNGTVPTANSLLYTGSVTVSATETLEAIAIAPGYSASPAAIAAYTISGSASSLDFTVRVQSSPSQVINVGGVASYKLLITPTNGMYPGPVVFAANGLPSGATATFSPSSLSANAGTQTVIMTVQTPSTLSQNTSTPFQRDAAPIVAALLLPLLGVRRISRHRRNLSRLLAVVLVLLGSIAGMSMLTGCGSGGVIPGTLQSYTLTVAPTSGSVQHTTQVTLTIQ